VTFTLFPCGLWLKQDSNPQTSNLNALLVSTFSKFLMSLNIIRNVFPDPHRPIEGVVAAVEDEVDETDDEGDDPEHHERELDQLEDEQFPVFKDDRQRVASLTAFQDREKKIFRIRLYKKKTHNLVSKCHFNLDQACHNIGLRANRGPRGPRKLFIWPAKHSILLI
jgi:hypothetical protein